MNLKIIGLAALAVTALMAFGAVSASAAKVCSTAGTGNACEVGHGKEYTGPISATTTKATLTPTRSDGFPITSNIVTCNASSIGGEVTNASTGAGKITSLTLSGCSAPFCANIPASASGQPWAVATHTEGATQNTNGRMTVTDPIIKFACPALGPVICEYTAASGTMYVQGSDVAGGARLIANNVVLTKTAGLESFCGVSVDFSATYTINTPSTFVVE
jgi:hypothetical protein